MPEGDTVWHTAAVLGDALVGKTLNHCYIRVPGRAIVNLSGRTADAVFSRGEHLFIRVGSASIHSQLTMNGGWRVRCRPIRVDHRVGIFVQVGDVRAASIDAEVLDVLHRDRDGDVVAHLGPDLLGDNWDPQVAAANLVADPDRSLAAALRGQTVMAGIGNVYCSELCFISGHLPSAPVSAVADRCGLVVRAREMLWANRLRWIRCTTGDTRAGRQRWVYGRGCQPGRCCGNRRRLRAAVQAFFGAATPAQAVRAPAAAAVVSAPAHPPAATASPARPAETGCLLFAYSRQRAPG